ncbi:MAG: flagellar basal-body MS-ring/collar protein FliF [Alphaproteobacteria bacterium]|nr:flagellar basal-body MS-ring/collar protein FliF [Alphaproteobacteria bacterium]
MNGIVQLFHNLGPARVAAIGAVAVALMAFFIFMMTRLTSPNMQLLYGDLDQGDATQIVNQLSTQSVPFELRNQGTEVLVPADQVADLRLSLAELGFGGRILGNEIFDRDQSFGVSSEQQETNRRRALEGELARTISTFTTVRSARVHLVTPSRELFSREVREPSASVILRMRGGQRLDREQVLAIQHLVATAVDRLTPGNITIADDRGSLLARGGDDEGQAAATASEMQVGFENRLARRLEELLEKTIGFGKVRAEVRAEVDMSQVVQNVETFDPEGQVLRSNETIEEVNNLSEGEDPVTVANNLPDGGDAFGGAGGVTENSTRTEERSNFEISKTLINTVKAPGEVRSVSVAILVDGDQVETGVNEDGEPIYEYRARTPQEMEQIEALVRSAIGFEEGVDSVEIVNMPFADPVDIADVGPETFFGFPIAEIRRLIEILILGGVGLLIALLVIRPLISKIFEVRAEAITALATEEAGPQLITDQSGQLVAVGPEAIAEDEEDAESMIDIAHIEGRVKASSMKKIGEIIDKHPEEAVSILRNWMYAETN